MIHLIDRILNKLSPFRVQQQIKINQLINEVDSLKLLLANIALNTSKGDKINDFEFKVFSQWGEDGIIQYLISNLNISSKTFIEFGVETYRESNTRFLLMNNNWRGLVIDGSESHVKDIKSQEIYWKYDLTAVSQFITKENINNIFTENGFTGKLGILSVDIDGNDYWVWQVINVVEPDIVIAEYNSVFGMKASVSVPYDANFYRTNKHYSNLYFGASLKALTSLANRKGYALVACNNNGNNCFFVKRELLNDKVKEKTVEEVYVESRFRESRDKNGELNFINQKNRIKEIGHLEVVEVDLNKQVQLKDVF